MFEFDSHVSILILKKMKCWSRDFANIFDLSGSWQLRVLVSRLARLGCCTLYSCSRLTNVKSWGTIRRATADDSDDDDDGYGYGYDSSRSGGGWLYQRAAVFCFDEGGNVSLFTNPGPGAPCMGSNLLGNDICI